MAYRLLCGVHRTVAVATTTTTQQCSSFMLSSSFLPKRYPLSFTQCHAIHSSTKNDDDEEATPSTFSTPPKPQRKRLDIALVGAPNAGKSQLLNSLIGSRSQSHEGGLGTDEGTRTGILGARTFDDTQLVFIDTPGFLHHKMGVKEGVRQLLGVAPSEMVRADETYLLLMRHGHWKRM